jgi:hypothetical protein
MKYVGILMSHRDFAPGVCFVYFLNKKTQHVTEFMYPV